MEVSQSSSQAAPNAVKKRLSPSILARLIICPAYIPAPFDNESRIRLQGLHAMTILRVISRHIKNGFQLKSLERRGKGFRIDLEFQRPDGWIRVSEVKSARELTEVHRIQAALYSENRSNEEVVVSNGTTDIALSREYIEEIRRQAEATRRFLMDCPNEAVASFRPNSCVCHTCANTSCPFHRSRILES
jgi:hypothetical protein